MQDMVVTLGPSDAYAAPLTLAPGVLDDIGPLFWDQENPTPANTQGAIVKVLTRLYLKPTTGEIFMFTREHRYRADGRVKYIGPEVQQLMTQAVECA